MNSSKPVLIAVPTNEGTTVFPKMLGMAKYFNIYSATDGKQFTCIEKNRSAISLCQAGKPPVRVQIVLKQGIVIKDCDFHFCFVIFKFS